MTRFINNSQVKWAQIFSQKKHYVARNSHKCYVIYSSYYDMNFASYDEQLTGDRATILRLIFY